MYDAYATFQASSVALAASGGRCDHGAVAFGRAVSRFNRLHSRARVKRLLSKFTGRSRRLLDLDEVRQQRTIDSIHEAGCVTIEIERIKGSECRACDFDHDFLPLSAASEQRWASVYAARMCGVSLPAICLVQVGNVYYVRDGHHRVSVARTLGEHFIEANVQLWQVKGETAAAPAMSMRLVSAV